MIGTYKAGTPGGGGAGATGAAGGCWNFGVAPSAAWQ
jgi:hypothetical protein